MGPWTPPTPDLHQPLPVASACQALTVSKQMVLHCHQRLSQELWGDTLHRRTPSFPPAPPFLLALVPQQESLAPFPVSSLGPEHSQSPGEQSLKPRQPG